MANEMNNLSFGDFTLDCSLRQLRRGGEVLPVNGKSFDLLVYMAKNAGRPLHKAELLSAVWPDTIVEEASLSQNVWQLRKVIGSGSDGPILTLPGRGYQFAARVTKTLPEAPKFDSAPQAAPMPPLVESRYSLESHPHPNRRGRRDCGTIPFSSVPDHCVAHRGKSSARDRWMVRLAALARPHGWDAGERSLDVDGRDDR